MIDQIVVKTSRGDGQLLAVISTIEENCAPTVGDLLYAGQRQRTRILDRTAHGVDSDNVQFHPYSTNGPYYYYPGKNAKNRSASARDFAGKIGLKGRRIGKEVVAGSHSAARTRLGIKFSSYAAFKSFLGRGDTVDLRGASAPHMLQAMVVRCKEITLTLQDGVYAYDNNEQSNEMKIAIYGDEAGRAEGHNYGKGHLPRRHFMGANEQDKSDILRDILERRAFAIKTRLRIGQ